MNFKKIILGTISFGMCVMLIGCSQKGNTTGQTTAETTTEATTAAVQTKAEYKKGTVTDNEYVNEWLGIKYTLPENYIIISEEQFNQAVEGGADIMYSDDAQKQQVVDAAKQSDIYEMTATNTLNGENVIVMVQDLGMSFSEEQFAQLMKNQLNTTNVTPQYKEMTKRTVAGIEFTEMSYEMTYSGATLHQTLLFKNMDTRMVLINCTYQEEDGLNRLLSGFSEI